MDDRFLSKSLKHPPTQFLVDRCLDKNISGEYFYCWEGFLYLNMWRNILPNLWRLYLPLSPMPPPPYLMVCPPPPHKVGLYVYTRDRCTGAGYVMLTSLWIWNHTVHTIKATSVTVQMPYPDPMILIGFMSGKTERPGSDGHAPYDLDMVPLSWSPLSFSCIWQCETPVSLNRPGCRSQTPSNKNLCGFQIFPDQKHIWIKMLLVVKHSQIIIPLVFILPNQNPLVFRHPQIRIPLVFRYPLDQNRLGV